MTANLSGRHILKPPVPRSNRKHTQSQSQSPNRAGKGKDEERETDKSNYVDQRELDYEKQYLNNQKRFFVKP
jgi:hypothetical protein